MVLKGEKVKLVFKNQHIALSYWRNGDVVYGGVIMWSLRPVRYLHLSGDWGNRVWSKIFIKRK